MKIFYNILSSISNSQVSQPEPPVTNEYIRVLVIGDSVANGTSTGTGDALPETLYEFDGTTMVEITEDTIDANSGSPYPAMAAKLNELTGRKMHLVETALGGSEISVSPNNTNWTTSGNLYGEMITKANDYLTNQNVSKFDVIRITLGINDAFDSATIEDIESDLDSLINRLNTDFPNTKILYDLPAIDGSPPTKVIQVRNLIKDHINTNPLVYQGVDLNNYGSELFMDIVHLNQAGNDLLGEQDAVIMVNEIL